MTECTHCRKRYENGVRFCPVDGYAVVAVNAAAEPWVGRRLLGQFQIESVCGQGATGTVYRAVQAGMDRQVAVKVLRSDLVKDTEIVKRFVREARAGAKLNHPNIATVHLVGQTEDGVPFLVMEYVEGSALAALLDQTAPGSRGRPLPLSRIVRIGSQIASALAEAHAQGIVHRDLKPENILLAQRRGESDVVKVVDFGIAKMLAHAAPGEDPISRMGTVFGTPHYIAPEQAAGQPVDGRADLYSLGCILFQMATGRVPFDGQQGLQVLLSQVRDPAPDPRKVNPRIDEELAVLVSKLLAKEPAARPQTAEAVQAALLALTDDRAAATEARPRSGRASLPAERDERGERAARTGRPARDDRAAEPPDRDDREDGDDDGPALRSDEQDADEPAPVAPPRSGRPRSGRAAAASGRPSARPSTRGGDEAWYARDAAAPRRRGRAAHALDDGAGTDLAEAGDPSFWQRHRMVLLGVGGALFGGLLVGVLYSQLASRPVTPPPAPAVAALPPPAPPPQQKSSRPATPLVQPRPAAPKRPENEARLPAVVFPPSSPPLTGPQPVLPTPGVSPPGPPAAAPTASPVPTAAPQPAAAPAPAAAQPAPAPAQPTAAPPAAAPSPAAPPVASKPAEPSPDKPAEPTPDRSGDKPADKPPEKPADEPEEPSRDPYDRLR